jgi:hypothetical protein
MNTHANLLRRLAPLQDEWTRAAITDAANELDLLGRENEALRKLLVPDGECVHTWHGVTFNRRETASGYVISFEEECLKCLRRRPCALMRPELE